MKDIGTIRTQVHQKPQWVKATAGKKESKGYVCKFL